MIEFFVAGVPKQKGSTRAFVVGGRARITNACKTEKPWAERVHWIAMEHRPSEPWEGPVRLDLTFYMPRPKSAPKKQGAIRHTGTPDASKCWRSVEDALTGVFYLDDRQVAEGGFLKLVCDVNQPAGVMVRAQQVPREYE